MQSRLSSAVACRFAAAASKGVRPDTLPLDHHDALLPRPFERLRAGELAQLDDPEVRVEGKGQQHLAHGRVQVRHSQAQQVLHVVGDRDVLPERAGSWDARTRPTSRANSGLPRVVS